MLLMFHRKKIYKKEIIDSLTSNISYMVNILGHLEPNQNVLDLKNTLFYAHYK